jgi:hypothetical protein
MSKRKPPPSKHPRSAKTATKAQRSSQAIVESQKDVHFQSVVTEPTDLSLKGANETERESLLAENPAAVRFTETEQEALFVENLATAVRPSETKQEPFFVANSEVALKPADTTQDVLRAESPPLVVEHRKQKMKDRDSKKELEFSTTGTNVQAYQAKMLEVAQANMQFAFEFAQRLAAIRLPFEFLGVTAEFTSKRIAMFQKHSKEIAELSHRRP